MRNWEEKKKVLEAPRREKYLGGISRYLSVVTKENKAPLEWVFTFEWVFFLFFWFQTRLETGLLLLFSSEAVGNPSRIFQKKSVHS